MKSVFKIFFITACLGINISYVEAQNNNADLNAFVVMGFMKKDGKMLPLSDFSPNWKNYKCNYKIVFNSKEIDIIDENRRVKEFFVVKDKNLKLTDESIGQVSYNCTDRDKYDCTVTLKMGSSDPNIFAYLIVSQMTNQGLTSFIYYLKQF